MRPADSVTYSFGPFLLDLTNGCLLREGKRVNLPPKVFSILCELVIRQGDVVSKDDLMNSVWAGAFVGESSLSQAVFLLRKALGRLADGSEYIETLSKRGYRMAVPVVMCARNVLESNDADELVAAALLDSPEPQIVPQNMLLPRQELSASTERRPVPMGFWWKSVAGLLASVGLVGLVVFGARNNLFWKKPSVVRFSRLSNDGLYKERLIPLLSDGMRVYFSEDAGEGSYLAEVSTAGGETFRRKAPSPIVSALSFSPKLQEILFGSLWEQSSNQTLLAMSLTEEASHSIGGLSGHAASWSPQSDRIAFAKGNSLFIANADGEKVREIAHMSDAAYWPRWSPDGERIRFSLHLSGRQPTLWEVRADGSDLHAVFQQEPWATQICCGDWTPDGRYYVFVREQAQRSALWIAPGSTHSWFRDVPVQLADGPVDFWRAPLVAQDGRHIFALGEQARGELVKYDRKSGSFRPFLEHLSADTLSFSRDGQWMAYTLFPEGTLWRSRVDGTERLRLTEGPGIARFPQWSPDGTQILYITTTWNKSWQVHRVFARGDKPEVLVPDGTNQDVATWSADGKRIAFGQLVSFGVNGRQQQIRILDLPTGRLSVLPQSTGMWTARWSPDGRFLSAVTTDNRKLMLYDFNGNTWTQLADVGTNDVVWSRTGDALFFDSPNNPGIYHVDMKSRQVSRLSGFESIRRTGFFGWNLNIAPDNEPFLLREAGINEVYSIEVNLP